MVPTRAHASVVTGPTARSLADAIAQSLDSIVGASFVTTPSPHATAVSDVAIAGMPMDGSTYAVLTTGDASLLTQPNSSGGSGAALGGSSVRGSSDFDVTVLRIDLNVPSATNCLVGLDVGGVPGVGRQRLQRRVYRRTR